MKLETGRKYVGVVKSIESYGAVLQFEDGSTHLLHISHISDQFVSNINDYVEEGESIEVFTISGKVKPVELTVRQSEIDAYYEDDNRSFGELLEEYLPNDKDIRYKDRYSNPKPRSKKRASSRNKRK